MQLITDEDSAPASVKSFSAFGSPEALEPATTAATRIRSGYTGHETDAETGLVNMGGRLYDARLGRVLQADPPFAEPPWSQGLNRYSYALNNPLNLIDPSGFFSDTTGPDGNREIVFDDDSLTAELPDSWETLDKQEAGSALPSSPAGRTQHEAEWESAKSLLTDREKVDYLLGSSSEADCGYAAMSCPSASDYPKNRSAHLDIDAMARDQQASWEARILHDARIIEDGAITPTANVDDLLMPLKEAAGAVLGVVLAKRAANGAGGIRMGLGLGEAPGRVGYRAWAESQGLQTWDEIAPRMYGGDLPRVQAAMRSADELHFNMDGFRAPQGPQLGVRFGEPVSTYSSFEYSIMRTQYADKSFYWLGDQPFIGPHRF